MFEKYLSTYNKDLLKLIFFILSALGTGAAPKALDVADVPIKGNTCVGMAVSGVVCNIGSAKDGTCPGMALAYSNDRSTITEGTSCPFTASSLTTSLTLRFNSLGFGELVLKIQ
jgi:hypothetical protein